MSFIMKSWRGKYLPLLTTAAFDGDHGVVERDPSTDRKRFAHFAVQSRVLFFCIKSCPHKENNILN